MSFSLLNVIMAPLRLYSLSEGLLLSIPDPNQSIGMAFYCVFLDALDSFFNHVKGVQVTCSCSVPVGANKTSTYYMMCRPSAVERPHATRESAAAGYSLLQPPYAAPQQSRRSRRRVLPLLIMAKA
jgi:hypothetical protein